MQTIFARGSSAWTVVLISCMIIFAGCFSQFYQTNSVSKTDDATIQKMVNGGKYFILHAGNQNFELTQVKVNNNNLEAALQALPIEHQRYLHPRNQFANKFPESDRGIVLYEVHLYTRQPPAQNTQISIPVSDLYQVDIYELDDKATHKSKVRSTVGISLATAGAIGLIVGIIATKNAIDDIGSGSSNPPPSTTSSGTGVCSPQVYAHIGNTNQLAGILYSGAIFAPLQRTDYMPLAGIDPANNMFHLQIKGSDNEEQIIHDTKLLQVTHDRGSDVLVDHNGKVLVYHQPEKPVNVYTGETESAKKDVSEKDGFFYSFTNHPPAEHASNIILDFKKPVGVTSGKLLLRARNSYWGSYLFKKFKSMYGDYYPALIQQKDKVDAKKLIACELDQSLPLSVFVKDGDSWKFVDYFHTPGNEVLRDLIMEINLPAFTTKDHVQIKLETTYMFWDLDYAGMDFTQNTPAEIAYVSPGNSVKSGSSLVIKDNEQYGDIHLSDTEQLNLDFTVKPVSAASQINSYFLVGTGYYHDHTKFEGKAQLVRLAEFSQKGAFDKFSRETFGELSSLFNHKADDNIVTKN